MAIPYEQFIHPEDLNGMKLIKANSVVVGTLVRLFNDNVMEGNFRVVNMSSKIRLSPQQLPNLYNILPPICKKLGITEPEFYLEMNPFPNSYTFGNKNPFIVINSGLVESLTESELKCVVAHECGHILCQHCLYTSISQLLLYAGDKFGLDIITAPMRLLFLNWCRKSELSADRVAAFVMNSAESVVKVLIRLSGGGKSLTNSINLSEYLRQVQVYDASVEDSKKSRLFEIIANINSTHPLPALRCKEITAWWNDPTKRLPVSEEIGWNGNTPEGNGIIWNR